MTVTKVNMKEQFYSNTVPASKLQKLTLPQSIPTFPISPTGQYSIWDQQLAKNGFVPPAFLESKISSSLGSNLINHGHLEIKDGKASDYPFESTLPTDNARNQLTPELVEPRIFNYEPCSILRKKVKPSNQEIASLLPPIQSFNKGTVKTSPLKRKSLSEPNTPNKTPKGKKGPKKLQKTEQLSCGCQINLEQQKSPFYTHLGSATGIAELHADLSKRYDVPKNAINIKLIKPTKTEGKNGDGCPLARWVIRRTGPDEKYLVIVKENEDHTCQHKIGVVAIVAWEGITEKYADQLYEYLTTNLSDAGFSTRRRCGTNDRKTCLCQGKGDESTGASFTFGCSWSMFFDGCKFAKSTSARKFKMQDQSREKYMETVLQTMTTNVSPLLKVLAPEAFNNMTRYESVASDCRVGNNIDGRPFSGVTCCLDFCAHSHKDQHNMNNGTTMVCTLLKPDYNERSDEQLHVLPLYQMCDDQGNVMPPNFQIPNHFMHSCLQNKQAPLEGKGRYVCPQAVNKKTKLEEIEGQDDERKVKFVDEKTLDSVFNDSMKAFSMFVNGHTNNMLPNLLQNGDTKQENFDVKTEDTPLNIQNSSANEHDEIDRKFPPSTPTLITDDMGGVAIALGHGSFLIECAKKELHATTALKNPCRSKPTRLSMVFYQHKKLNRRQHGYHEYAQKEKQRRESRRSFDDLHLLDMQDTNSSFESPEKLSTNLKFPQHQVPFPSSDTGQTQHTQQQSRSLVHDVEQKSDAESSFSTTECSSGSSMQTVVRSSIPNISATATSSMPNLPEIARNLNHSLSTTERNSEPNLQTAAVNSERTPPSATRNSKQCLQTDTPYHQDSVRPVYCRDQTKTSRFSVDSIIGSTPQNDQAKYKQNCELSNFPTYNTFQGNGTRNLEETVHQSQNDSNKSSVDQSKILEKSHDFVDYATRFLREDHQDLQHIMNSTNQSPHFKPSVIKFNHLPAPGDSKEFPPPPHFQQYHGHNPRLTPQESQQLYEWQQRAITHFPNQIPIPKDHNKPHTLLDQHNEIMKHFSMGLPTSPKETFLSPVNPLPEDLVRAVQGKNTLISPTQENTNTYEHRHPFYRPSYFPPHHFTPPVSNGPPHIDQKRLEQVATHIHNRNISYKSPYYGGQLPNHPTLPTNGNPQHPLSLLDRHANMFVKNAVEFSMPEHYGYSKMRPETPKKPVHPSIMLNMRLKGPQTQQSHLPPSPF